LWRHSEQKASQSEKKIRRFKQSDENNYIKKERGGRHRNKEETSQMVTKLLPALNSNPKNEQGGSDLSSEVPGKKGRKERKIDCRE